MVIWKILLPFAVGFGILGSASPALSQGGRLVLPQSSVGTAPYLPPGLRQETLPRFRQPTIAEDIARPRAVRRQLDASDIRPDIRTSPPASAGSSRARAGQPGLDRGRAGDFARSGPAAIGASPVTRPSLGARRIR